MTSRRTLEFLAGLGEHGARGTGLLAHRADATPTVQASVLDLIGQQATSQREARPLAYLMDRVRLAQHRSQVYGMQVIVENHRKASPLPAHSTLQRT